MCAVKLIYTIQVLKTGRWSSTPCEKQLIVRDPRDVKKKSVGSSSRDSSNDRRVRIAYQGWGVELCKGFTETHSYP